MQAACVPAILSSIRVFVHHAKAGTIVRRPTIMRPDGAPVRSVRDQLTRIYSSPISVSTSPMMRVIAIRAAAGSRATIASATAA